MLPITPYAQQVHITLTHSHTSPLHNNSTTPQQHNNQRNTSEQSGELTKELAFFPKFWTVVIIASVRLAVGEVPEAINAGVICLDIMEVITLSLSQIGRAHV